MIVIPILLGMVVLALSSLLSWYFTRQKVRVERDAVREFNLKPESVRPDSEFFESNCPDCQFAVFVDFDNTKKLIGHGFRFEDQLIMPAHVLGVFPEKLWITKGRRVESGWYYDNMVRASKFNWVSLMADVVIAKIGEQQIPGLKKAKVTPYWGNPMVSISTCFDTKNSSIGPMKQSSFGMLEYAGSTRSGFSGAVYMLENKVAAMHLGGGVANVAVAASYLATLAFQPESSEVAALRNALKRARKEEIQWSTTGDPDLVQVHVRGRYYRVDREEFDEVYAEQQDRYEQQQEEYEEKAARKKRKKNFKRDKFEDNDFAGTGDQYDPESLFWSTKTRSVSTQTVVEARVRLNTADVPAQTKIAAPHFLQRIPARRMATTAVQCDDSPEAEYQPESVQENLTGPTLEMKGGPQKACGNLTPCLSQSDPPDIYIKISKTLDNLLGRIEMLESSREVSRPTTPTVSQQKLKYSHSRSKRKSSSQRGSHSAAQ